MKIAIIGAGLSGLACAGELWKNGITPVIFERASHIGQLSDLSTVWLRGMNRTLKDPVAYLQREYGLKLTPTSMLEEIVFISHNKYSVVKGKHGSIFKKGREDFTLESQLALLAPEITFDTYADVNKVKSEFDYVVIADGSKKVPESMGLWTDRQRSCIRYATVLGDFKDTSVFIWLNRMQPSNTFCYLVPLNSKAATLVLAVNDITLRELEFYWNEFLSSEGLDYTIVKTFDQEYHCGNINPRKVDNLYFTGNAGGFVEDLMGLGAFYSIESGLLAARSIIHGLDYDKLVDPIGKELEKYSSIQKSIEMPEMDIYSEFSNAIDTNDTENIIRNPVFRYRMRITTKDN